MGTLGTCWGYGRGSTEDQEETLLKQAADIKREYDHSFGEMTWGGVYLDRGVSGGVRLVDRPEGYRLSLSLRPGDVVMITALDRAFRDIEDLAHTTKVWAAGDVRLVILNLKLDTGTPIGRFTLQILGAVAEFERALISERVSNWWASRRARGAPAAGRYAPYGYRRVKRHGRQEFVEFPEQRALGARIVEWMDGGWSQDQVYYHLRSSGVVNPNTGETLSRAGVLRYYKAEKRARQDEASGHAGDGP